MSKQYDILLFGVSGFTGRLAAEHLLAKAYPGLKWGVCGRNPEKTRQVMNSLPNSKDIPVEVCDLVCDGDDEVRFVKLNTLRDIVAKAKVVITAAGPFEKYGVDLVRLCAELGVHYADITGETDFVRQNIEQCHEVARRSGASIVSHCGHDCIPWDLTVLFVHREAQKKGTRLSEIRTFADLPILPSGGTIQTIKYQMLEKKREKGKKGSDPLLSSLESVAEPSKYTTAVKNPKSDIVVSELDGQYAGPWVMGAVMANCVRRSNALLGYNENLVFADAMLRGGFAKRWSDRLSTWKTGLGIFMGAYVHPWFTKASGDGPSREEMEQASMVLHAFAKFEDGSDMRLKYSIPEDPGYLNTAKMLVESGMTLLLSTRKPAGVIPPAMIGDDLLTRCQEQIGHVVEIVS